MKKAAIIIGKNVNLNRFNLKNSFNIGVERGCLLAIKAKVNLDIAVGDFDSVSQNELKKIYSKVKRVIKLNPVKDETDTYCAYNLVDDCDKILILGGIQGKRVEHFLATLNILKSDPRVEMIDDYSRIYSLDAEREPEFELDSSYKYTSIFALEDAMVTLKNFKYPLNEYRLEASDSLGISNEILPKKKGQIDLLSGRLLVIQSKDDH